MLQRCGHALPILAMLILMEPNKNRQGHIKLCNSNLRSQSDSANIRAGGKLTSKKSIKYLIVIANLTLMLERRMADAVAIIIEHYFSPVHAVKYKERCMSAPP